MMALVSPGIRCSSYGNDDDDVPIAAKQLISYDNAK